MTESNDKTSKIALAVIPLLLAGGIIAGVAVSKNNVSVETIQPTSTVTAPPNPNREYTLPGEKINMPFGKPDIVTVCNHGNRLYQSFYDTHSYGGVTFGLTAVPNDPTCPKD